MIVGTEKVLAGSGWVPSDRTLLLDGRVTNDLDAGWKGGRPLREPKDHQRNFREEDRSKIETLFLNSQPRFLNYKMKFVV